MAQNNSYITDNFESRKNAKAGGYTAGICAGLLIIFLFVKWTLPVTPPVPEEEGIEVNLGNSDLGLGEDQPMSPDRPAPSEARPAYTPPKASPAVSEPVKDIETDDKDEDAPNESDSYKKGGNQGVAGGTGDQGKPGGNPDSKNYEGGGRGTGGVTVSRGLQGRRITGVPLFEDEFNENAKVAMDITVDGNGKVVSATYQPRGSTTSDPSMKEIARRKALQVRFSTGDAEAVGTIIFNFRLKS
ncbi:MAG: hypothetical protein EOO04_06675 [Chitinophagaceae bacterium]|nr:MAG: hypothetical protein EOO04_06675 [Chitinophagaceae bacterium]